MQSRLQTLLRPKWLDHVKKRGAKEVRVVGVKILWGPRKADFSKGSLDLPLLPTRQWGSLLPLKGRAVWSWQGTKLRWASVSSLVKQGWNCLPLGAIVRERHWGALHQTEPAGCTQPLDRLSGASPLTWLICQSSLPVTLHDLSRQDTVSCWLSQACALVCPRLGDRYARTCMCVCVSMHACMWAEGCIGISAAWTWTLPSKFLTWQRAWLRKVAKM